MNESKTKEFFELPYYLARSLQVQKILNNYTYSSILDLGSGDGGVSIPLIQGGNIKLTLVDFSKNMVESAKKQTPNHLRACISYLNMPIEDFESSEKFDVIICIGVFAHVLSIDETISVIKKHMNKDAIAIVEFTQNPNPIGKYFSKLHWFKNLISQNASLGFEVRNKISLAELKRTAKKNGLELIDERRHLYPLPGMRHWPRKLFDKYINFTSTSSIFNKIGVEHLMVYRVNHRSANK